MLKNISRLHFITDNAASVTEAVEAGVNWIQLRIKNENPEIIKQKSVAVKKICKENNAVFIINDFVEIVREVGADGVHLGKDDMNILSARKLLGDKIIIGASTNSFEDIFNAVDCGADYVGLGPFRFTKTKSNLNPVLGLDGFEKIMNEYHRSNLSIPVIAIGGITIEDVEPLMQLGIHGVAVSSAINFSKNKKQTVNDFLFALNKLVVTI